MRESIVPSINEKITFYIEKTKILPHDAYTHKCSISNKNEKLQIKGSFQPT